MTAPPRAPIIAESEAMRAALATAERVAPSDATVLLGGESGVGKERIARLIHDRSRRAAGPFVAVNCGAVVETLLESELFGHARGAFTGAVADRAGLFEAAHGGTLLLDEIGEVPLHLQPKLLRALQEREVRRVGETRARPVDVRLLAATNRDLPREVQAGRFRADLYYRLKVIDLPLPPLRARKDDVLPMARAFLDEAAARLGRSVPGFHPEAEALLAAWHWPGNARELRNAVERAVVFCDETGVRPTDLPDDVRGLRPAAAHHIRPLAEIEREHLLAALAVYGTDANAAARALGLTPAELARKLRRHGVGNASA